MNEFWKTKLAAWIHDPAEKALVLMRTRGKSHENGSLDPLRSTLGIDKDEFDRRADWIAAGADRPKWPDESEHLPGARVIFANDPILIHPLDGTSYDLKSLAELEPQHLEAVSFNHFDSLIEKNEDGSIDYRLTHLAFWRFGYEPKLCAPGLSFLWQVLPADTRIPDHTIWQHLDIASALAGALYNDTPSLLTMSFGPVQTFIEQARSTSDLWAGSHLLSSLVWEGMKVLCDRIGPDAVLFPNLRGVPAVDRWILATVPQERRKLWKERFSIAGAEWPDKATDENPLFAATLPNKFVAIVPARRTEELTDAVRDAIRTKALQWARDAAGKLFGDSPISETMATQIAQQVSGFPESFHSTAKWPVSECKSKRLDPSGAEVQQLKDALAAFYPQRSESAPGPGLFGSPTWKVLGKNIDIGGASFYQPGAGILYPAVYDLGDRSLGAAKSFRPFAQLKQEGYRCTLCGEREWLTSDRDQLARHTDKQETAWSELAGSYGIKKGEHLCAICTLKRVWPSLFVEELKCQLDKDAIPRFIVSTHAMSLAPSLSRIAKFIKANRLSETQTKALAELQRRTEGYGPVALPKRLAREVLSNEYGQTIRRIPGLLDDLGEAENGPKADGRKQDDLNEVNLALEQLLGSKPETYYAFLLMDGDHMGAWISGTDPDYQLKYLDTFHRNVREELEGYLGNDALKAYLEAARVPSPAHHSAISAALNNFSSTVVRYVIEDCCSGRLIYSGGDDVLAMLPVDDLLRAIGLLRSAYSGTESEGSEGMKLGNSYAHLKGRLMMMMGSKATASIGAVVAHHQAPLRTVLRDLRAAEHAAKAHGRNAFSIRIMKRAGGEVGATARFSEKRPHKRLVQLVTWLRQEGVSRRAVYHSVRWLHELPELDPQTWAAIVATNLPYQMKRQSKESQSIEDVNDLARQLIDIACEEAVRCQAAGAQPETSARASRVLEGMLETAEFLARETRSAGEAQ